MKTINNIILYVDDDADDRELLSEAMHKIAPDLQIIVAQNGLEALTFLKSQLAEKLPALIVLDLNMPYLDGIQTYECIVADPHFKQIPLVVLTSGANPTDKALFGERGVPYFNKPSAFTILEELASSMAHMIEG